MKIIKAIFLILTFIIGLVTALAYVVIAFLSFEKDPLYAMFFCVVTLIQLVVMMTYATHEPEHEEEEEDTDED